MFISIAAITTFTAQLVFAFNFFYSMFNGRLAPANPWRSNTLEWSTPRFPKHGNWVGEIPSVHRWPYDYSKPGAEEDFIPQYVPLTETKDSNLPHENELMGKESEKNSEGIVVDEQKV
jgi:cytochrome c oxidase subunit 1